MLTTLPPADGGREVVAEAARVTALATPSALGVPSSGTCFQFCRQLPVEPEAAGEPVAAPGVAGLALERVPSAQDTGI